MNRLSLYELSSNYLQALDFLTDPETDLPVEAVNDTLEALGEELEDKAINVAKFFRNMEATANAIKIAEENMAKRRKALEHRVQWLKNYIKTNMESCGISDIECPHFKLSIQQNPAAVNILDEDAIPEQFKEKVITWKIDKAAIKDAIKSGAVVPGTELVSATRLTVK
ncbi:MAG: siphovirus Gp157 family protein [Methylobacter sp.]